MLMAANKDMQIWLISIWNCCVGSSLHWPEETCGTILLLLFFFFSTALIHFLLHLKKKKSQLAAITGTVITLPTLEKKKKPTNQK